MRDIPEVMIGNSKVKLNREDTAEIIFRLSHIPILRG